MDVSATLATLAVAPAAAAKVVDCCPRAVQSALRGPVPAHERETGNEAKFNFGTAGAIMSRAAADGPVNVIITTACNLAKLTTANKLGGSKLNNRDSVTGDVVVKRDAHKPGTQNVVTFKEPVFAARFATYANRPRAWTCSCAVRSRPRK